MSRDLVERNVRAGVCALAEALPIDLDTDWQRVLRRAELAPAGSSVIDLPRRRPVGAGRRRRRALPVAIGVAALIAVAAVGLLTFDTNPAAGTPTLPNPLPFRAGGHASAVALLGRAAAAAETTVIGSGPVRYAQTRSFALQTAVAQHSASTTVETTLREVWLSPDGSAVAKSALQDTTRAGTPIGSPSAASTDTRWQDANANLPTTGAAVADALNGAAGGGPQADAIVAQLIMAHLAAATTTPEQTAILYRLLASLPGVFDAGMVTDDAGRRGQAVGIVTGHFDAGSSCSNTAPSAGGMLAELAREHSLGVGTTYLVIDAASGQPLEVEAVDTPNAPCGLDLPPGPTTDQYTVILKAGAVTDTGVSMP